MIYLDNAATSYPKPVEVADKVATFIRTTIGSVSRRGYAGTDSSFHLVERTRHRVSKLINGSKDDKIVFTLNATDSINGVLNAVLKPGDHVLTGTMEHLAVSRTLAAFSASLGIEREAIPLCATGRISKDILHLIRPTTKLAVFCYASNVTGDVLVTPELCALLKQRGVLVLLDAAQAVGSVRLDVAKLGADFVAFSCHKGLMGVTGLGCLWIAGNASLPIFRYGGIGIKGEQELFAPESSGDYEAGTPNTVGIAALAASLDFIDQVGFDLLLDHKRDLLTLATKELGEVKGVTIYRTGSDLPQLPVISFNIDGLDPVDEVAPALEHGFGIISRAGLHCAPSAHKTLGSFPRGTVRVSFGWFNTSEDVEALVRATKAVSRG